MSSLAELISARWPEVITFLLVLGRTGSLVISAPFWGSRVVPGLVRVWTAVALSLAIYPLVRTASLPSGPFFLVIALGGEVLLGLGLGWAAQILFAGMRMAGQQVEIKMGLGLAQVVDPQWGGQSSLFSSLFELIVALVFFSLNGHHLLIQALASSYRLFPLAGEKAQISPMIIASAGEIFTIALRVSAPVVVGLLLSDIVLGIVSRVIPQMNVFLVALPLQIGFGVLLLMLSLPALVWFCVHYISAMGHQLSSVGLLVSWGR